METTGPVKPDPRLNERPTCNCVLLCDDLITSSIRQKHTLSGVFTMVLVRELPSAIGPYVLYIRVSNVYPGQPVFVSLDPPIGETLFRFRVPLPDQPDPLGLYTVPAVIAPFVVSAPGRYMLTVSDGEGIPLAMTPIMIVVPDQREEGQ
jgi:hypothetical protein